MIPATPIPVSLLRAGALSLGLALLGGCAAVSTLNSASQSLPTFDLTDAAPPPGQPSRSSRVLLVAAPTASSAINTDRIVIRPNVLEVAYLPDGRWIDAAPVHVQALLVRSIANSGAVGFVGGDAAGPVPDFVLLTDLQTFQAELALDGKPTRVAVRMTLTLVRDLDRRLVAARTFEGSAPLGSTDALAVAVAFDSAMRGILREATRWTVGAMGGRVS